MNLRRVLRRVRAAGAPDDGMSMVEVTVAIMLLMIAGAIFLGALTSVYTAATRQERRSELNDEARAAIQQIDREVRSGNFVANGAGNYLYDPATEAFAAPTCGGYACDASFSVRVYSQANATTRTPPQQCVQYLVHNQLLLRRSWAPGAPTSLSGWRVLARGIVNRNVTPEVPAFFLDGGAGTRVLGVTLLVNNRFGQPEAPATVRIATSIAMRNFGSGDPCTPIPSS
jgi:type II secretory pathway pseudopilin PulG